MSSPAPKINKRNHPSEVSKRDNVNKSEAASNIIKYVANNAKHRAKNRIRKSLLDYEREKLTARGLMLFMQRIFIFVKNLPESQYNSQQQSPEAEEAETEHLGADQIEEDNEYQRTFAMHQKRNSEPNQLQRLSGLSLETTLRKRLESIVELCNHSSLTADKMTGLFLYMGNYSLIVVEGAEYAVEMFCTEFVKCFTVFWVNNKVFHVEDNISQRYFESFVSKSVSPIYTNQKFPSKNANDEVFMGEQHWIMVRKLQTLCRNFHIHMDLEESFWDEIEITIEEQKIDKQLEFLAKHAPDVQRFELVLQSQRFYRNIIKFTQTYLNVPIGLEDEQICWPVRNNFTPYGLFLRSKVDYNLTYPESNKTSEEKTEQIRATIFMAEESGEVKEGEEGVGDVASAPTTALLTAVTSAIDEFSTEGTTETAAEDD